MIVLKCKCCGGTVVPKDNGIGECDSCGRLQTIPNTNDEKKLALIDRANHFRMNNEFDKALEIYEKVIEEDSTDSSVYYNIALCRYGIVYVDDPSTKKKVPTIYRFQADNKKDDLTMKKFTDDADFKMAIKYAKPEQIDLYNEEAQYIDELLSKIMDIIKTEKPYDIFICYKETDENDNRTEDSVLAYEIYNTLNKEGYRVFFSRITLKGLPGIKYEPYIYSALITSKVMIVVGTKTEYMNAVWVKNEWSRFINLINNGADKTLIPAYKNITPYDFPNEFAGNQGISISDIAFKQDLLEGIKKIIGATKNQDGSSASDYKSALVNKEVESALKRAKSFIEEKNWEKADEYCEKALDIDAENGEVYLYKLLIEAKCTSIDDLKEYGRDFSELSSYSKVLKYANKDIIKMINDVSDYINFNDCVLLQGNGKSCNHKLSRFSNIENYSDKLYKLCVGYIKKSQYSYADQVMRSIKHIGNYREEYNKEVELQKKKDNEIQEREREETLKLQREFEEKLNKQKTILDFEDKLLEEAKEKQKSKRIKGRIILFSFWLIISAFVILWGIEAEDLNFCAGGFFSICVFVVCCVQCLYSVNVKKENPFVFFDLITDKCTNYNIEDRKYTKQLSIDKLSIQEIKNNHEMQEEVGRCMLIIISFLFVILLFIVIFFELIYTELGIFVIFLLVISLMVFIFSGKLKAIVKNLIESRNNKSSDLDSGQ